MMKPDRPNPMARGSTHQRSRRAVLPKPCFVETAVCATVRLLRPVYVDQNGSQYSDNSACVQQRFENALSAAQAKARRAWVLTQFENRDSVAGSQATFPSSQRRGGRTMKKMFPSDLVRPGWSVWRKSSGLNISP